MHPYLYDLKVLKIFNIPLLKYFLSIFLDPVY